MVVVHPEYAFLILEINDLKEQIADLMVEKDMLRYYICREIQIDYMLKIGALEYKLVVAENNYEKSLRKLEIVKEKLAKKLRVNMDSIDRKINNEFKKKSKIEADMSDDIDFAIEVSSLELFDYDIIDEMNVDYFKLQKLYNPIFDLDFSEEKEKMFEKIQKYYKRKNYKKLHKLAESYDADDIFQDEISNLKKLKENYTQILKNIKRDIRKMKNTFPYNQKIILEDENLCRRKKDSLNKEIMDINLETKKVEKKISNQLKKL